MLREVMTDRDHERHVRDLGESSHKKLPKSAAPLELRVGELTQAGPSAKLLLRFRRRHALLSTRYTPARTPCPPASPAGRNPRNRRNRRSLKFGRPELFERRFREFRRFLAMTGHVAGVGPPPRLRVAERREIL